MIGLQESDLATGCRSALLEAPEVGDQEWLGLCNLTGVGICCQILREKPAPTDHHKSFPSPHLASQKKQSDLISMLKSTEAVA